MGESQDTSPPPIPTPLPHAQQVVIKGSELQLPFQACLKMEKLGDRILRWVGVYVCLDGLLFYFIYAGRRPNPALSVSKSC